MVGRPLQNGIKVNLAKIKAMTKSERKKSPTKIHSFMGLVGYYQWFIQGFSLTDAPLTALTHKGATYIWSEKHEEVFEKLKKQLREELILTLPDGVEDFEVYSDASGVGIGCVLT